MQNESKIKIVFSLQLHEILDLGNGLENLRITFLVDFDTIEEVIYFRNQFNFLDENMYYAIGTHPENEFFQNRIIVLQQGNKEI